MNSPDKDEAWEKLVAGRAAEGGCAIVDRRRAMYGDATHGHASLGKIWTGLVEQHYGITLAEPMPAHLVAAMMVGLKLARCCVDPTNRDTRLDIHGYATLLTDHLEELDSTSSSRAEETEEVQ